jgi:hypothetical protein
MGMLTFFSFPFRFPYLTSSVVNTVSMGFLSFSLSGIENDSRNSLRSGVFLYHADGILVSF